jgi:hypothetical protein
MRHIRTAKHASQQSWPPALNSTVYIRTHHETESCPEVLLFETSCCAQPRLDDNGAQLPDAQASPV